MDILLRNRDGYPSSISTKNENAFRPKNGGSSICWPLATIGGLFSSCPHPPSLRRRSQYVYLIIYKSHNTTQHAHTLTRMPRMTFSSETSSRTGAGGTGQGETYQDVELAPLVDQSSSQDMTQDSGTSPQSSSSSAGNSKSLTTGANGKVIYACTLYSFCSVAMVLTNKSLASRYVVYCPVVYCLFGDTLDILQPNTNL